MSTRNLDGLKTQTLNCIEAAYDKGYKAAKQDIVAVGNKSEYERGLADAERAIKRLCLSPEMGGLSYEEENIIFGRGTLADTLDKYTMAEIIEKIRKYDEQKEESVKDEDEIHVGDEVYYLNETMPKIVTCIDGENVTVLYSDGKFDVFKPSELTKTGRHYDIVELLKKLGEDSENSISY